MLCRSIRRASAILALTAACLLLPLSDASAAPRQSESRWNGVERSVRVLQISFRNVLKSFWAQLYRDAGMDIDGNG